MQKYGSFVSADFIRVDMSKCAKTKPCQHIVEFTDTTVMLSGKVIAKKFWAKLSDKEREHFAIYRNPEE
jgi:hypothetical protein